MKAAIRQILIIVPSLMTGLVAGCSHQQMNSNGSWDPKIAAAYLDQREAAWTKWQGSARDHGTFCVSCHTAVPYALSRPMLRKKLGEGIQTAYEQKLLDNVTKRVRLWNEVNPFYSDQEYKNGNKTAESRGTESVLNALILANYDAANGHLSDTARLAFDNMWALQETEGEENGSWAWLQFGMEPWEAGDSQYYGAALAAIAVGIAPENYRSNPDLENHLRILSGYLDREYAKQSMLNHVVLLWASTKWFGLLTPERRQSIINEVLEDQQGDGGWKLSALSWPKGWSLHSMVRTWLRSDGTSQAQRSDGYATGLIVFVLQQSGMSAEDARLKRGLAWLVRNQSKTEGSWPSLSLTKRRNPSSEVGHFMRDAATAYAVLALTEKSDVEPGHMAAR